MQSNLDHLKKLSKEKVGEVRRILCEAGFCRRVQASRKAFVIRKDFAMWLEKKGLEDSALTCNLRAPTSSKFPSSASWQLEYLKGFLKARVDPIGYACSFCVPQRLRGIGDAEISGHSVKELSVNGASGGCAYLCAAFLS